LPELCIALHSRGRRPPPNSLALGPINPAPLAGGLPTNGTWGMRRPAAASMNLALQGFVWLAGVAAPQVELPQLLHNA